MGNLSVNIYSNKKLPGLRFENVRSDRTVVVDRAVVVGRTFFARKADGKLLIFDANRTAHHTMNSRGALKYLEAAWRLGAFKKSDYETFEKAEKVRREKEGKEQAAGNALDYARQAGATFAPGEEARLKKIAGR